jgi:hypothetical protein
MLITSDSGDISEAGNDARNMLLQSANTDWSIDTRMVCSRKPSGFSQYAGLVAYQDDDNFIRLVYRASFGRGGFGRRGSPGEQPGSVELMIEKEGDQMSPVTLDMDGIIKDNNTLILRLVKKGELYTASCSADGENFLAVGTSGVVLKDIKAGLIACDGTMPERFRGFRRFMPQNSEPVTPFEVAFDYFHIENSGLKQ